MPLDVIESRSAAIRTVQGGTGTMKLLSEELRESRSSAVIILERVDGNRKIRGYISYKNGAVVEALFKTEEQDGSIASVQGREALKNVWHEALNRMSRLRVYNIAGQETQRDESKRVTVQHEMMKRFKKVKVPGPAVTGMSPETRSPSEQEVAMADGAVDSAARPAAAAETPPLSANLKKGREKNVGADFNHSAAVPEEGQLQKGKRQQKDRNQGRKQAQEKTGGASAANGYDDVYTVVFGSEGNYPGVCPECGSGLKEGSCPRCGYIGSTDGPNASGLNPSLSFSNYVVGPGNKFPYAASMSIVELEGGNYNPLYVHAPPGLGKTHLLNAIGNLYVSRHPGSRVMYTGGERFSEEIDEFLRGRRKDTSIRRYRNLDMLLFDDIQFLAGKDRAQEEFLAILNAILGNDCRVICAGDRPIKEIRGLDSQISSRLESGLIVDIRPPDLETRMKILDLRIKEENYAIPAPVVKFIAESFEENVRELTGALNRVVAYSALMRLPPSIDMARRILRSGQQEQKGERKEHVDLKPGHGYLIEEDRPDLCHLLVQERISDKWAALDITRMNPTRLRSKYPGLERARIVWLTDRESEKEIALVPSLEKIEYEIKNFMEEKSRAGLHVIVNIDDIQYVISNTNFEGTVRLLRRMIDEMSERNSLLLVSVGKDTLGKQEMAILERELDVI